MAALAPSCSHCGNASALSRCAGCRLASYCNRECQKADYKIHKAVCGFAQLPEEYPPNTLDELRKAFPKHTIIDGSDVTFHSLPSWVDKLEKNPTHLLVVLRRRSATRVTPSDQLFQYFGIGPHTDPTGVVSALATSSAILVFHKDDYYHLIVQPMPVLVRFIRRRVEGEQEIDKDCPVCFETLPLVYAHRVECTTCGMCVCDKCVVGIMERDKDRRYECPGCRDKPEIKLYAELVDSSMQRKGAAK